MTLALSNLEKTLLEVGFNKMGLHEQNQLIVNIATVQGRSYADITAEDVLEYHRQLKITKISGECEKYILTGFVSANGHTYSYDRYDQINMIDKRIYLQENPDVVEVAWKTEDSGFISHTREAFLALSIELSQFKEALRNKYAEIKQAAKAATTHEEIVSLSWNTEEEVTT